MLNLPKRDALVMNRQSFDAGYSVIRNDRIELVPYPEDSFVGEMPDGRIVVDKRKIPAYPQE